jgi:hypothetical protein
LADLVRTAPSARFAVAGLRGFRLGAGFDSFDSDAVAFDCLSKPAAPWRVNINVIRRTRGARSASSLTVTAASAAADAASAASLMRRMIDPLDGR